MRAFWVQAHWIVGITAGVVLAFVGATGAILSFEHAALEWLNGGVRQVPARQSAPLGLPEVVARVRAQKPEARIERITVSTAPGDAWQFRAGDETLHVDPYTGEVTGAGERGGGFFRATRSLHRWLVAGDFGDRDVGRQIVGACTGLLVVLAVSGIYLRWPRGRARNWRAWLTFDPALKGRTFLWHLHAVIGTCVLPLYLVMALTGLHWSYEWYRDALYAVVGAERPTRPNDGARGRPADEIGRAELDRAWAAFRTATAADGYGVATVSLPRSSGAPVTIRYLARDASHDHAYSQFAVDAGSGAVLRHERHAHKTAGARLMAGIEPLHTGSFFGAAGTILYGLASAAMPVFAVTGWMMYLLRRRRARASRDSGAATAGALLPASRRR
jgi:sulfite reductase (NADPH) flavoprotein alpha-component